MCFGEGPAIDTWRVFYYLATEIQNLRGPLSDSLALVHKQKKSPELTENIRDSNINLPNPVLQKLGLTWQILVCLVFVLTCSRLFCPHSVRNTAKLNEECFQNKQSN